MVISAHRMSALYMRFKGTGICGGETTCEIGGHLGCHLEFLEKLRSDYRGLLVCCRG